MLEKGEDSLQRVGCFIFLQDLVAVEGTFVYLAFLQLIASMYLCSQCILELSSAEEMLEHILCP